MRELKADVAIVGASAIGCICAKHCAKQGLKTIVLEEHSQVGKQGKCTAIVSRTGLEAIGINYRKAGIIVNSIGGANIWTDNHVLRVRRKGVALVLNRQKFDEQCALEARKAGAQIKLNHKITLLSQINAKFIVGADGASSTIARLGGFPAIPARKYALGYEAEFSGCVLGKESESIAEIFLDNSHFHGLFGWIVPSGKARARIGFATTKHEKLEEGKQKLFALPQVKAALGSKSKKIREFHALIPLQVRKQTQKGNVLLVGDAAGQVKATTGGGIVFGGLCAKIAAQSIANELKGRTPALDYEQNWQSELGSTLKKHAHIRSTLNHLPNFALGSGLGILSALGFESLLERKGDMDFVFEK